MHLIGAISPFEIPNKILNEWKKIGKKVNNLKMLGARFIKRKK